MRLKMDVGELDKLSWIPLEKKEEIRRLMAEWTVPEMGYLLIIQPPTPEREGYAIFQPCVAPVLDNHLCLWQKVNGVIIFMDTWVKSTKVLMGRNNWKKGLGKTLVNCF